MWTAQMDEFILALNVLLKEHWTTLWGSRAEIVDGNNVKLLGSRKRQQLNQFIGEKIIGLTTAAESHTRFLTNLLDLDRAELSFVLTKDRDVRRSDLNCYNAKRYLLVRFVGELLRIGVQLVDSSFPHVVLNSLDLKKPEAKLEAIHGILSSPAPKNQDAYERSLLFWAARFLEKLGTWPELHQLSNVGLRRIARTCCKHRDADYIETKVDFKDSAVMFTRLYKVMEEARHVGKKNRPSLPLAMVHKHNKDENDIFVDLASAPNALIVGPPGSGKSSLLLHIVCQLARFTSPFGCMFILIDPKGLEFTRFLRLPHCQDVLTPPDISQKVVRTLDNLIDVMDYRFSLLRRESKSKLDDLNSSFRSENGGAALYNPLSLPKIVVVMDEFGAIIREEQEIAKKTRLPRKIAHLASLGRAVGIHFILANQTLSADLFPEDLQANFPARIGFNHAVEGISGRLLFGLPNETAKPQKYCFRALCPNWDNFDRNFVNENEFLVNDYPPGAAEHQVEVLNQQYFHKVPSREDELLRWKAK